MQQGFPDDFNFSTCATGMMGADEPYIEDAAYWRRKIYADVVNACRRGRARVSFCLTDAAPSVRLQLVKELCDRFYGRVLWRRIVEWEFVDEWKVIEDPETCPITHEYALNLR